LTLPLLQSRGAETLEARRAVKYDLADQLLTF